MMRRDARELAVHRAPPCSSPLRGIRSAQGDTKLHSNIINRCLSPFYRAKSCSAGSADAQSLCRCPPPLPAATLNGSIHADSQRDNPNYRLIAMRRACYPPSLETAADLRPAAVKKFSVAFSDVSGLSMIEMSANCSHWRHGHINAAQWVAAVQSVGSHVLRRRTGVLCTLR